MITLSDFKIKEPTKTYEDKNNTWIEKWISRNAIDENWKQSIKTKDGKPGKMYRMINTCNYRNSARIITRTAFKKPSIFIEKCLFTKYLRIGTRIQDTKNMLNMINDLNRN